jgi:hypothetical protein
MSALLFSGILFILLSRAVAYNIIREYAGSTFFDRWDFYGGLDNLTLGKSLVSGHLVPYTHTVAKGNATWVSKSEAMNQSLAYVNSEGHVIIKVDNTTNVPSGQNRNSVRRLKGQGIYS